MLVTDLQHFLTEAGDIPRDLPRPALTLLKRLGSIVAWITAGVSPNDTAHKHYIDVPCARRPGRQACPGPLLGGFSPDAPASIWWECAQCGDAGLISGWEETAWDQRAALLALQSRGWKRRAGTADILIPVSCLQAITVYRPGDFYDFVRLWLELRRLFEMQHPGVGATLMRIDGLMYEFASFVDFSRSDLNRVRMALEQADFPMAAFVVSDDDTR
jgi:hypothetical protein